MPKYHDFGIPAFLRPSRNALQALPVMMALYQPKSCFASLGGLTGTIGV